MGRRGVGAGSTRGRRGVDAGSTRGRRGVDAGSTWGKGGVGTTWERARHEGVHTTARRGSARPSRAVRALHARACFGPGSARGTRACIAQLGADKHALMCRACFARPGVLWPRERARHEGVHSTARRGPARLSRAVRVLHARACFGPGSVRGTRACIAQLGASKHALMCRACFARPGVLWPRERSRHEGVHSTARRGSARPLHVQL